MARLVSSVSDVLDTLQKDRGAARPRLKADLQRAPARGARPRGCSNGETGSPLVPGEGDAPGAALGWSLPKKRAGRQPAWRRDLIQHRADKEMGEIWQEGDGKLCPRRGVSHRVAPRCPQTSLQSQHESHFAPPADPLVPHAEVAGAKAEREATVRLRSGAEGSAARDSEQSHSSSFGEDEAE